MWMQPAPAHHLGPMRMGLREPVETNPLCRVVSHALFGLGGWGPGPPRLVERRDAAETGPTPQAKNPGRPKNRRRALAGRPGAASDKSARLMPNSPLPVTAPSSRGSCPKPTGSNRMLSRMAVTQARNKSPALAHRGWHARNQIESSPCRHHATPQSGHPRQLFNL